jgi:hypothetical protein
MSYKNSPRLQCSMPCLDLLGKLSLRVRFSSFLFLAALLPIGALLPAARGQNQAASARSVFERRILPLLKSPNPSSCAECHLSGVDLKDYLRPSEAQTFASLRDSGMIDVKKPEASHILRLIRMSMPKTGLVTQKVRDAEYTAFRDWITAAVRDPTLRAAPSLSATKRAGPAVSNAVLRHTRLDSVVASFERNVWSQEGRCMGCHRPGTPGNAENFKKYGERVNWFVPDSPEATMRHLIDHKLINIDEPEKSLFLLKPLNVVAHGGGVKMLYGDAGYKQFRAWIEDYAASVKGKYRSDKDLPVSSKDALVYTDCILTVNETPEAWGDKNLRVDAYAWDTARNAWTQQPVATGDRGVFAKGRSTNMWMWLIVPAGSEQEKRARQSPRLAPGRYLLKYYCDTQDNIKQDYTLPTNSAAFYQGQQEIMTEWKPGWTPPTTVRVAIR